MRLRGTNRNFRRVSPRVPFNPRKLFRNGEQGIHYDPSDLSTLFQDSAGTTPVTAVEQPVGLMLDKRLGLVLGPELVTNGTFDGGVEGWSASAATLGVVSGALRVTQSSAVFGSARQMLSSLVVGRAYTIAFDSRTLDVNLPARLFIRPAGYDDPTNQVATASVTATSFVRQRFVYFATSTSLFLRATCASGTVVGSVEFDNISVRELPGNHAFQATAIDRPILRQDAQGNFHLAANGTNTWMQTNSIDFTATDKVKVFAGVRKLSDETTSCIIELSADSAANNGTFLILGPGAIGQPTWLLRSRGSITSQSSIQPFSAPDTAVITLDAGISTDRLVGRRNGVQGLNVNTDQGTGNYGNYPLYLFRRGGTSLPFNGNFYGLLIRGALTSDPDTLKMEKWLSFKTGVQL